jgi:D-methionine transport system substrate-binding protein
MNRRTFAAAAAALAVSVAGFSAQAFAADTLLRVGATPVPHADILHFVAPELKKEGIELKVIEFTDYVQPNIALADKELDANFFQHVPYLESFCASRGLKLSVLASVHIEPMGVYSNRVKSLKDLKKKAAIAIPNDPTNGGRALAILAKAGLFDLKPGVGVKATVADIINNVNHYRIIELEAATLPRTLADVDIAVINSNYALGANLNPTKDAIFSEPKDSPYANVVAVRTGDKREALDKLAKALTTPAVKQFLVDKYKGAVVPAF